MKSPLSEAISVTLAVTTTLDELGVSYVVGGSVASSVHGIPRSTADSDLVAALREEHVDRFVSSPHLATMFKVDVFVPPLDTVMERLSVLLDARLARGLAGDGQCLACLRGRICEELDGASIHLFCFDGVHGLVRPAVACQTASCTAS